MKRLYTRVVTSCYECPHGQTTCIGIDELRVRCGKLGKPWDGDEPPEWCPLPKVDEKEVTK